MLSNLNFSLTQLEYVMAVYKLGHFAKAAEFCNVTQPTLSMQLQKLEENLGIILFDRTKKPVLLTDAGKSVIEQIQLVLFEAKKIDALIKASGSDKITGDLTVGVIPTIAPYILPRLLPVLEKQFPDLELKIFELQTHKIIEALDADEIDVGLLATPLKISRIFEYPLFFEPFHVLCRKDHELAQLKKIKYSSLKFNDIWLLEEGHCLRNQILDVCSIKKETSIKRKYKFESGSLETIKNLINSYGGYTLIPSLANEEHGGKTVSISFERPIPAREIGLVYRREHYKVPLIESLAESILDSIPQEIRKIRQKDLDILPVQ
ncbi:MAG: LysR substrate-binding domain-containing protein [Bdellovibrionaceae bacterium]|nr:LysR substrate-binding domain-containing protein [Pseudobdellovibrionaceae bacterium]NUM59985.1 LysR family transcriptional regulator [Pseudobdellovibrionaceae bacterium]